ncbi:MAG: DUF177 domain-containing protein [Pseudomonadota bacterium]
MAKHRETSENDPEIGRETPGPFSRHVDLKRLAARSGTAEILETASDDERRAIAEEYGLLTLEEFQIRAELTPWGRAGWRLDGQVTAELSQACVQTLDPVPASLSCSVERRFGHGAVDAKEVTVDIDDERPDVEPIPDVLDVGAIALEEFSLALDPYPRVSGALLEPTVAAPPGVDPNEPLEKHPFADLAELREKLAGSSGDDAAGTAENRTDGAKGAKRAK